MHGSLLISQLCMGFSVAPRSGYGSISCWDLSSWPFPALGTPWNEAEHHHPQQQSHHHAFNSVLYFHIYKKNLANIRQKKKKNFWKCTHHPTKIYINQSVCFNTCSSQIQLWRWRGGGTSVLPPRDLRSCSAGGGRGARGWAGQGGAEEGLGGALLVLIPLLWGWGGEKEMKQLSLGLICVRQRI